MNPQDEIARLKQAIAAQEALRGILPDEQIEATLQALQAQLARYQAGVQGSGAAAQGDGSMAVGHSWPSSAWPSASADRANSNRPAPSSGVIRGHGAGQTSSRKRRPVYWKLTSWENLLLAYQKAAKGKRGHPNVAAFEYLLEDNLLALRRELRDFTYRPGTYVSFHIHEPKRRLISAAPFRDRVVHHALCNLIEPIFERTFIDDSYANRAGKGTHRALNRAQTFARRYPYVLQCDVVQFFPSIDHVILRGILHRKIRDGGVRWLMDRILESGQGVLSDEYRMVWFPGDDLWAALRPRGLPIGNLTSQFWGNIYLNGFDHFVKRALRCRGYLRYVDDCLLFGESKAQLWAWKEAMETYLASLRLTIHPGAHPRLVTEGFPFLGFVVYPERRRLKRRKGVAFARKLRRLAAASARGEIALETVTASVQGWVNHARYGNTVGLRKAVLGQAVPLRRV